MAIARPSGLIAAIAVLGGSLAGGAPTAPEAATTRSFSLEGAVEFALHHVPTVRASAEGLEAATEGVALSRTRYLPRMDALWQVNRGTRNNVFGPLLPQSTLPSVSGPVLPSTSDRGVWGSAAGLLLTWEPFDFGYRRAAVRAATDGATQASADEGATRFDVSVAALNACFALLASQQTLRAAAADVERRTVFARSVHVLVDNQLRPGADASRADAELARARAGLARARQLRDVARATVADRLGIDGDAVEIREDGLSELPPSGAPPAFEAAAHPFARSQQARVEQKRAEVRVSERAYAPKLELQSAFYGRGSGADTNGAFEEGTSGLRLERYNWAVGLTLKLPVLDVLADRSRTAIAKANERAEEARYERTLLDVTERMREAAAALEGAREVAESTRIELDAARVTEAQEQARYRAGLATIVNVSDAQGLLVQAEIDDSVAGLVAWQSVAAVYASGGDLEPFFDAVRSRSGKGP